MFVAQPGHERCVHVYGDGDGGEGGCLRVSLLLVLRSTSMSRALTHVLRASPPVCLLCALLPRLAHGFGRLGHSVVAPEESRHRPRALQACAERVRCSETGQGLGAFWQVRTRVAVLCCRCQFLMTCPIPLPLLFIFCPLPRLLIESV